MPEYLRVLDRSTGHKLSRIASSVTEDAYEVLDEPAVGLDGLPLPPVFATPAEREEAGQDGGSYLKQRRSALEDEVAKRNADRDEADHVVVDAPGNKPELAAALEADDRRQAADPISPAPDGHTATDNEEND